VQPPGPPEGKGATLACCQKKENVLPGKEKPGCVGVESREKSLVIERGKNKKEKNVAGKGGAKRNAPRSGGGTGGWGEKNLLGRRCRSRGGERLSLGKKKETVGRESKSQPEKPSDGHRKRRGNLGTRGSKAMPKTRFGIGRVQGRRKRGSPGRLRKSRAQTGPGPTEWDPAGTPWRQEGNLEKKGRPVADKQR